jgi:beta-glucanase (GH16 family)
LSLLFATLPIFVANSQSLSAKGGSGGKVVANTNKISDQKTFSIANSSRQLVWSDEFDTFDDSVWGFDVGGDGWGNNELQYYTEGQNAYIDFDQQAGSKVLVIEARKETLPNLSCSYGNNGTCQYSSARLISKGKKSFSHGRIEARLKLPQTQGIWPAFWMLGDNYDEVNWPQSGEIDIMEHIGSEPTIIRGAIHGPGYSGNTPFVGMHNLGVGVDANYHTYAIEWDSNGIRWFVDDTEFYSVTRTQVEQQGAWVFDQPFWLLLNVAVGGKLPGQPDDSSVFPQRMYVDYIRFYQ